ncbi:hypothetical protein [Streptomyces roseicoloratus]|uniref:hypothetical protein n=1 Tax=Streptomyces roseicoloratus TaxID=2508722 RepID=UPI00100998B4|nr:hypothetical protein [Streptomyces roseicoloratus]
MGLLDLLFRNPEEDDESPYELKLRAAAGIGIAKIRCHADTWAYFLQEFERTSGQVPTSAFRPPANEDIVRETNGMITVPISGSSLAALLDRCCVIRARSWSSSSSGNYGSVDKAIASRVEAAISEALTHVVPASEAQGAELTIVLDDRPVAKTE